MKLWKESTTTVNPMGEQHRRIEMFGVPIRSSFRLDCGIHRRWYSLLRRSRGEQFLGFASGHEKLAATARTRS